MYTSPWLTTREALDMAISAHPDDLVERCAFIRSHADTATTMRDQACWLEALAATRGIIEPPYSDPRPDPRTHPEYWTE